MKRDYKLSLRLGLLAGLTSLTLLGTTAGSLAWYAYSRTVTVSYVGTSVATSELLNVGIVDNDKVLTNEDLDESALVRQTFIENNEEISICWATTKNGFSLTALQTFLERTNRAVNKLHPVTTLDRTLDDTREFKLYHSPEYSETAFESAADYDGYAVIPFAFRIIDENLEYVPNKEVWLTESVVECDDNIENAVRVYVEGTTRNFLMKPADQSNNGGATKVGGVLDLNGDGFYDYDRPSKREYCYGLFNSSPSYSSSLYPEGLDTIDDVNGVNDPTYEPSTFLAKHHSGIHTATFNAKEAAYYSFGQVKPTVTPTGVTDTTSGIPIAATSNGSKIGYATFTIFIEGWDHSVVDKGAGHSFNLGLKFEISR